MPTWLLKLCVDELLPIIISIVNASMDSSCVPRAFMCDQIRPLLKKPTLDPDILKHYRPVSNLPFIAKVLEKVVDTRIERHLVSNGLHEELQSAYRRSHSTKKALLKVKSDILESLDNGCFTLPHSVGHARSVSCVRERCLTDIERWMRVTLIT